MTSTQPSAVAGIEPRGCPTPGACSCVAGNNILVEALAAERINTIIKLQTALTAATDRAVAAEFAAECKVSPELYDATLDALNAATARADEAQKTSVFYNDAMASACLRAVSAETEVGKQQSNGARLDLNWRTERTRANTAEAERDQLAELLANAVKALQKGEAEWVEREHKLAAQCAEHADEYRKVELLWKEACVARDDYKQQADAKDALWVDAYTRANQAEAQCAGMVEVLTDVREACFFSGDDGGIGVTDEPNIDSELFNRINAAIVDTPALAQSVLDRVKNARTPGTVEVCEWAMPNRNGGQKCVNQAQAGYECEVPGCPIRAAAKEADNGKA